MYTSIHIPLSLFLLISSVGVILAVPTWEGMNGRSSIGSLIPGVSHIQAMGPVATGGMMKHLALHRPGELGNITVAPLNRVAPPLFYINQEQLWLLVNETAVYPVNVHNSTSFHELPMQLVLGKKREGITNGIWRWKATMLYYDLPGGKSNTGLFYQCMLESGAYNVFMTPIASRPPSGCQIMTLHSFVRNNLKN
ncbi:hypothetical protein BDN70DRAFT_636300 [Pholiota conissans]|uniref:Uncharacterized protein n=1 Tax=Pholiota conissans TaxID=109636 RepID=A0A9P6CZL5_9AGAR|nr:hypothetical protein BDN70DRAFT_636300 [Pholiota conissans]